MPPATSIVAMQLRLALLLILPSCAPAVHFTPRGEGAHPAFASDCPLEVVTSRPPGATELGIVDFGGAVGDLPRDASHFRALVRGAACAAGGDTVVGEVNGAGQYVRGTVLRVRSPSPPTLRAPAATATAPEIID